MINDINRITLLTLLFLLPLLSGCVSQNDAPSGKILVATTIAPLGDFIQAVGGDKVEVAVLIPPGAEPHTFEPTPSQMTQVAKADLYVMNGAGLEYWMDRVLQVNRNMALVDSSKGVNIIQENGGEPDPHTWVSLRNAAVQVGNICAGLIQVDPDNAETYRSNRDAYLRELQALDSELNQSFASKNQKIFIVHHPAWAYFARDYDLLEVPLMENEKDPGPRHLAEVVDLARMNNITTIFVEPEYNPKAAEVIAREMKASIVTLDPLADNYLENMRHIGNSIAESMTP